MIDLAIESGLESKQDTRYRYDLKVGGKTIIKSKEISNTTIIPLPDKSEQQRFIQKAAKKESNNSQWEVTIQTFRQSNNEWSKWVKVYLDSDKTTGHYTLLGIIRQE